MDKKRNLRSGIRMFFEDTESRNFLCRQRRRRGSFFVNFLCKFETPDCFKFCLVSFAEDSLYWHSIELFNAKGLFLHLLFYTVYAKFNTILDNQIQALRPTRLGAYDLLVILIAYMWFCNLFNVSVRQSVGYSWTMRPFVVNLSSYPKPGYVVCSWLFCDWWLLAAFFNVA